MSAQEVVALYDPADVVGRQVGSAARAQVRAGNLPHAATAVCLRRSDGAVLVHRRAGSKDLWPGLHDCANGGVVLAGEDPLAAARRELREEVGAEPTALRLMLTTWYRDEQTHYLAHFYGALWDGPIAFTDGEVEDAWWMQPGDLGARLADPRWPFVPDTRRLLRLLFGSSLEPPRWSTLPVAQRVSLDSAVPTGAHVVHRYGREGRTTAARLGTVVQHDRDGLLLWFRAGSPTVDEALADGQPGRDDSVEQPASRPAARRMGSWHGPGTLLLVPLNGCGWSVWWLFDAAGRFAGWHANLEAPHLLRRTAAGTYLLDTCDRALGAAIAPDGSSQWRGEEEFAAGTGTPGRWSRRDVDAIRADGERLRELAARREAPFDGRWTDPPGATVLPLPQFPPDWDVPHLSGP